MVSSTCGDGNATIAAPVTVTGLEPGGAEIVQRGIGERGGRVVEEPHVAEPLSYRRVVPEPRASPATVAVTSRSISGRCTGGHAGSKPVAVRSVVIAVPTRRSRAELWKCATGT